MCIKCVNYLHELTHRPARRRNRVHNAPHERKLRSVDSFHRLLQSADFGAVGAVNTFSRSAREARYGPKEE